MRLIVLVGARPNFVKAGPLTAGLARAGIDADVAHTGQHYDACMSDVFFSDLDLPQPRWFLDVGSGTHAVQTGAAMMRVEELLASERPDGLVVVGDVNSTLAGALAASKMHVPVVHLEAGLRSRDMSMPEEVNRLVTDQLSAMLLAPTGSAAENLATEGIEPRRIHLVGNVMAESLLKHLDVARQRDAVARLGLVVGDYIVATVHRPENTNDPARLSAILGALARSGLPVIVPAHPRSEQLLRSAAHAAPAIRIVDPLGYLDMLCVLSAAAAVATDSGGVQEESCMLHVPCVTVRKNTERLETVASGANMLVEPTSVSAVAAAVSEALRSPRDWPVPDRWDEHVSDRIGEAVAAGVIPMNGCA